MGAHFPTEEEPEQMPVEFGECLDDILESRSLSSSWLAGQIGVHQTLVQKWLRGERTPDPSSHHIHNMRVALDLKPDEWDSLRAAQVVSRLKDYLVSEMLLPGHKAVEASAQVFRQYILPLMDSPPVPLVAGPSPNGAFFGWMVQLMGWLWRGVAAIWGKVFGIR